MSPSSTIRISQSYARFMETVQQVSEAIDFSHGGICQLHELGPFQGFPVHRHQIANEWIVVHKEVFNLITHEGAKIVPSANCTTIIFVPVGICHTINSVESGFRYAVIKDGPDDFIPCTCH